VSAPVYSVVAYSGTGKTTILERLIPALKARGLRVAVVKHDAHDFEIDTPGKDSWRMSRAGADVSCVCSDTHAAIMENRPRRADEIIGMIRDVDIILTEGFKHGSWRKIGIVRAATGKPLPGIDGEYFAVLSDVPVEINAPRFDLHDVEGLAGLIVRDMDAQENRDS
jgi:molybdopterin-guanine dinucleotide biosynthesis protein MobB